MALSKRNKYGVKNPFYYECVDAKLLLYKVYGPGLPKNGNNITICDEQSAKETVQECFKIYMAGWIDGKSDLAKRF